MYRGTTPTLTFDLSENKGLDLANVSVIWVTLEFNKYEHTFETDRCSIDTTNKKITITLTQEETLEMPVTSKMQAQIRMLLVNGAALSTNIAIIDVNEILKEGVIA